MYKSPLGRAEIYSVLGGSAGAGAGSITYDMLNEQAGITIANAITDEFRDLPDKEIDQDIIANALRATRMQLIGMQVQQHLTPFILGPLGKLTGKFIWLKEKKQKDYLNLQEKKVYHYH